MPSLSISTARTSDMEETTPPRLEQIVNRLKQIHKETKERNPQGFMDELDMRLSVHMMEIANEMDCSVIILDGPSRHFIYNFTEIDDEVVEKHVNERGSDSITIDFENHFD